MKRKPERRLLSTRAGAGHMACLPMPTPKVQAAPALLWTEDHIYGLA